jgi:hypothetical protein
MPLQILCPHCSQRMQVPDQAVCQAVRCPSCARPSLVPAARGLLHGQEHRGRTGQAGLLLPGGVPMVFRADQDQPGRGRQRPLLLRPRDQGQPGTWSGHGESELPGVPARQPGSAAVLRPLLPAADRPVAGPLWQLWPEQPVGEPALRPLQRPPAVNAADKGGRVGTAHQLAPPVGHAHPTA